MRHLILVVVVFALFLAACGTQCMDFAPELIDFDAITARFFSDDERILTQYASVPTRLSPSEE